MHAQWEDKNLITPLGYKKLSDEAKRLWTVERPKIVDEVHQAALQGDRSENAEYIYGKKKLREIDKRLRFLNQRLEKAKIIDPANIKDREKVQFGATVVIENELGLVKSYQIVGEDETDPSQQKISWKSPIGRGLLQKKIDDNIEVITPNGTLEFTILSIEYPVS